MNCMCKVLLIGYKWGFLGYIAIRKSVFIFEIISLAISPIPNNQSLQRYGQGGVRTLCIKQVCGLKSRWCVNAGISMISHMVKYNLSRVGFLSIQFSYRGIDL